MPEYLRLRFNNADAHVQLVDVRDRHVLIAGVNLYALALVLQLPARLADLRSASSSPR